MSRPRGAGPRKSPFQPVPPKKPSPPPMPPTFHHRPPPPAHPPPETNYIDVRISGPGMSTTPTPTVPNLHQSHPLPSNHHPSNTSPSSFSPQQPPRTTPVSTRRFRSVPKNMVNKSTPPPPTANPPTARRSLQPVDPRLLRSTRTAAATKTPSHPPPPQKYPFAPLQAHQVPPIPHPHPHAQFSAPPAVPQVAPPAPTIYVPRSAELAHCSRFTDHDQCEKMKAEVVKYFASHSTVPHQVVKLNRTVMMMMERFPVQEVVAFAFHCNESYKHHFRDRRPDRRTSAPSALHPPSSEIPAAVNQFPSSNVHPPNSLPQSRSHQRPHPSSPEHTAKRPRLSDPGTQTDIPMQDGVLLNELLVKEKHRRDREIAIPEQPSAQVEKPNHSINLIKQSVTTLVSNSNPNWAPRGASPERDTMVVVTKTTNPVVIKRLAQRNNDAMYISQRMTKANPASEGNEWKSVPCDKEKYIIWDDTNTQLTGPPARISKSTIAKFENLLGKDHLLHVSQGILLRYLWKCLVQETAFGTVLSGAMGSHRIQQVFAFASMYISENPRKDARPPRILIVVPQLNEMEWKTHLSLLGNDIKSIVIPDKRNDSINSLPNGQQKDLNDWKDEGGILICAEKEYARMLHHTNVQLKTLAFECLISPGPDVCVLDEASRLPFMTEKAKFMLRRTKTTARLALTGISLGGNLETMWHILNWACPGLLGNSDEFRAVYFNRITKGHVYNSSAHDARVAYRAASLLYKLAHPVLYPSFGLFDFNKYETRSLAVNSITIYTTIVGEQWEVYRSLSRSLGKCVVNERSLSPFVASYVLMLAGTSIQALAKLFKNGANFPRCPSSNKLEVQLDGLMDIFKKIQTKGVKRSIERAMKVESPKFAIVRHLFKNCFQNREKMVVYTSSIEVLESLAMRLELCTRKGGHVFKLDFNEPRGINERALRGFRQCTTSAILIAQYGPTMNTKETFGWGDLAVAKVVILDSGWNMSAEAQCVKRIKTLLVGANSKQVQVYNLVSNDTMESLLYLNAMDIYVSETKRLREGRTQHHDVSYWRSYLTRSEIDTTWVSKEPHNGRYVKQGENYIAIAGDERTTHVKSSLHDTSECLTRISNLRTQIGKHAVAFISAQRNRVQAIALAAEMCTRRPMSAGEQKAAKDEADAAQALWTEKSTKRNEREYGVDTDDGSIGRPLRNDASAGTRSLTSREPTEWLQTVTLASLWLPYYEMFEQGKWTGSNNNK